jgi:hypothetical protein
VKSGAIIFPDDVELKEVVPFKATHDWTQAALTDQRPEPIVERLEVTEIDTSNVTVLRRRDDDDGGGPDAA